MSELFEIAQIKGIITLADGETVEFSLGPDEDMRWGNTVENLGRTVEACELIRDALQDAELWDDGCVECPNCGERVEPPLNYEGREYEMCDSCVHNARRSGWEPGDA
jgi:hypothetical protein